MSFSFLGGLSSLLPGYIQGQRMAVQDNWQDLMNYNKALQGQQANLFTAATWQPQVDMVYDTSKRSALQTANDELASVYNFGAMPQMMNQIYAGNQASYWTAPRTAIAPYYTWENMMHAQRALPWSNSGGQQLPTNIG